MAGPLAGTVVLDCSESIAGQYCARLLADYGADTVLAEPPEGSTTRRIGPFGPAGDSLMFVHLNRGKRSVQASGAVLDRLLAAADIVVAGHGVRGAGVTVTVSDFGADPPWSGWRGCELVFQALSGVMNNNGEPGREPLYGCGHRASFAAGLAAYTGSLAALLAQEGPRHVDVSVAEIAASMMTSTVAYAYSGTREQRSAGEHLLRCRDGWIAIWIYSHQWRGFCDAFGVPHLFGDPRFAHADDRQRNWRTLMAIVQDLVGDEAAVDVAARMQAHRLIVGRAATLTGLLDDPHLFAREFWGKDVDGLPLMAPPFRFAS